MAAGMQIALVTGATKGIGLQIVKELCRNFEGLVFLSGRDRVRGMDEVRKLQNDGLNAEFLHLDLLNASTSRDAHDYIRKEHGGLDILVNNAGVLIKSNTPEEFIKETEITMQTNFTGLLYSCDYLFPLLRPHARVVNVSSTLGHLSCIRNESVKQKLKSNDLTLSELLEIMTEYENAVKKGNYKELGFPGFPEPYGAYPMSKIAITALSRIQQRTFDEERPQDDIIVNACHPGYVKTDMTKNLGTLSVKQGADTPVYLALLPPSDKANPRGELLSNRKIISWTD